MSTTSLASFPNSRISTRKATQVAETNVVTAPVSGTANGQLVKAANSDRTYLTLFNSGTVNIRYGYVQTGATLLSEGFRLKPNATVDIESPQAVYVISEDAATTASVFYDEGEG